MMTAIILDLDGVICDTAHFHFLAWERLAAEYGYALTQANNEKLKGDVKIHTASNKQVQWQKYVHFFVKFGCPTSA
mgnify:CR=1 FL=1